MTEHTQDHTNKVHAFFDLFHKTVEVHRMREDLENTESQLWARTLVARKYGITEEYMDAFTRAIDNWDDDYLEALREKMLSGKMTIEEFLRTGEHYD
jgi:hypothetical protein